MALENSGDVMVWLAKALNPFSISPIICCHNATGSLPLSAIGFLLNLAGRKCPSFSPYHTLATGRSTPVCRDKRTQPNFLLRRDKPCHRVPTVENDERKHRAIRRPSAAANRTCQRHRHLLR